MCWEFGHAQVPRDEGWEPIGMWTRLSSAELQGIIRVSQVHMPSHPNKLWSPARWPAMFAWGRRSHNAVCVRGNVSDQTLSEGTPTCAHSSISIAITAVVFQGARSSPDEFNDPHRKPANHTEYHYQSLLIKLDCFTTRASVAASFCCSPSFAWCRWSYQQQQKDWLCSVITDSTMSAPLEDA